MNGQQERQLNQAAFRRLRDFIERTYPAGRFLAISGGQIVADAASFEDLHLTLEGLGQHSPEVLVIQAGIDYPETAVIFFQGSPA